jgi:hypothetical protein
MYVEGGEFHVRLALQVAIDVDEREDKTARGASRILSDPVE